MKIFYKALSCILLLGIVLALIGALSILNGCYTLKPKKADCIIILGCKVDKNVPSPFLVKRLDEAIRLYRKGYSKYIIASGGQGGGESITEADAMRNYLISKGISPNVIFQDNTSTSTMTNLINSKEIMEAKGFKTALIVSNKYHLKRAYLMAKKLGIEASYSGVFNSNHRLEELSGFLREILAIMKFYILG